MNKVLPTIAVAGAMAAGLSFGFALDAGSPELTLPHHLSSITVSPSAFATVTPEPTGYMWPTGIKPAILTRYSAGANNWNAGHRGVDLAMSEGEKVFAASAGTVIYAGKLVDRSVISIEHPDGIRTTYEPVTPEVSVGDVVSPGDVIATIDGTHCGALGVCLHWGAKRGSDDYMNPLWLIDMPRVRLYR